MIVHIKKFSLLSVFLICNFNSFAEEALNLADEQNHTHKQNIKLDTSDQIKELKTELSDKNKSLETLETKLSDKNKSLKTLETELSDKNKSLKTLETELSDKNKSLETLETKLSDKNKSLEKLTIEIKKERLVFFNENKEENIIYLISGLLALTLLISLTLIITLYKWRVSIRDKDNQVSIVPVELLKVLTKQEEEIKNSLKKTDSFQKENQSSNREIIEIISTFRSSIEDKENELKRLKKGYDLEIYRKFLVKFIEANEALDDAIKSFNSTEDNEFLIETKDAKELLEFALEQTGIEIFIPKVGDDIRDAFGIDEQYRTEFTNDSNKFMKIAEVRKSGYFVRSQEKNICIIPAKVVVYIENLNQDDNESKDTEDINNLESKE